MAIAKAMGKVANAKASQMKDLADKIQASAGKTEGGGGGGDNQTELPGLQAQQQAASQEFQMLTTAIANVLQSIGGGLKTMAQKG